MYHNHVRGPRLDSVRTITCLHETSTTADFPDAAADGSPGGAGNGLPQTLGAHPWWATRVIWIGLPIGLVLAGLAGVAYSGRFARVAAFALLTLAAIATTYIGKTRFAASYAEDAVAGQMWYFGWIAICALTAATLASLLGDLRQNH